MIEFLAFHRRGGRDGEKWMEMVDALKLKIENAKEERNGEMRVELGQVIEIAD